MLTKTTSNTDSTDMFSTVDSIVVFTPGRTGSQLTAKNLRDYFGLPVIHSHDPLWEPTGTVVAFVSRRRNTFESILSTLVGKRSNEFTSYSNKSLESFEVPMSEFENCFWFHQCFYHAVDTTKFFKVVDVWYEDLIADPKYLFALVDIDRKTDYNFPKSPYNYYQLVKNIQECQAWYQHLVEQPVTQDLIDSFKSTIKTDLGRAQ